MHKRLQWLLFVLIALATLAGLFLVSYAGQSRILHSVEQVREAMLRKQLAQDYLASMLNAEAAQRGYVLTGGKPYLEPYDRATREVVPALDRLAERYSRDDAAVVDLLRRLRLETGAKLAELRTTLELFDRGGLPPALAVIQTDEGESAMNRIRALLGTLREREQRTLDEVNAHWQREVLIARWVAGGGSLLTAALLGFAALLILQNLRKQEQLNRTLQEQTTSLRRAVDAGATELSELAANLQNVAEREKAALARELHDDLGGTLIGAKMDLSWLRRRIAAGEPAGAQELTVRWERLERALEAGIDFKRRLVEQLRPTLLDNLGFYSAARWLVEETCAAANLRFTLELAEPEPAVSADAAIALFRVLQEALTNVIKHARASQVSVTVQADAATGQIRLVIEDDGVGISRERLEALGGHGLGSMRQRMRAIGGMFTARARARGGTEITALAPLSGVLRTPEAAAAPG